MPATLSFLTSKLRKFRIQPEQELSISNDFQPAKIELPIEKSDRKLLLKQKLCSDEKFLMPLRVRLRAKWGYRCSKCEHSLVKPENKAQSVKFKIRKMAL